ncbi:4-hydroxy-tetrahydrodipicolinate reductase [Anaerocolumna cellulosilytica]|uniref:4-hydroxy-tetrahydrodipicolinate reductase n=1 Tax=Anaerocolumna cellulosilytica TaxID=433286 RepID=A0A6S6R1H8_9FIRM|nr:4-hydroxy-tetrahydrodipicolinate reductase [Anaerocolumna cellulosilytica]MBB5194490.1 4-hydroxy-tetrahydrodipicolinate reductase [Anaerocolumna cellulosilytica]BCJ93435.1 4-hydroxy-tetrahydrodipicolinate reductase [Anaerocolumna cellulosilytica]
MKKIILRGCNGRMGQEITKLVKLNEQTEIVAGVDVTNTIDNGYPVYLSFEEVKEKADVIIDFASPKNISEMLEFAKVNKVPIVLCTTGLSENDIRAVEETAKEVAVLRSANMSLGVNVMIKLLKAAAKMLESADFDIEIVEKHHNQKLDAPSGTALALADGINEVLSEKYDYKYDRSEDRKKREKKEIGISAVRGGTIVGEHEVIFAGLDEIIEIKHTAYSRVIFAKGAVHGAVFLADKGPGLYQMSDVIS